MSMVRNGVPQGSILGPLLFLLFINDLPNASKLLNFALFADDTSILVSHKSYDQLFSVVNLELGYVNNWCRANKLSLNVMKTNYILFTSRRKQIPPTEGILKISDALIPVVSTTKFLGVYLDRYLTWNYHTDQISSKVAKNTGILSRISYLLSSNIRINLYYSMIHPFLAYCNLVWASNYQVRLKQLIVHQNLAIRVNIGCFNVSCSTDSLYKQLKIGQITTLQINELLYKRYNKLLPPNFSNYFTITFQVNPNNLRSSNNYRPIYSRTNIRMFSIKCAGPNAWNLIPFDLRCLPNLSSFNVTSGIICLIKLLV